MHQSKLGRNCLSASSVTIMELPFDDGLTQGFNVSPMDGLLEHRSGMDGWASRL